MPAHITNRVSFTFRLDETTQATAKTVAKIENRPRNDQHEFLIKNAVVQYEIENGNITIKD